MGKRILSTVLLWSLVGAVIWFFRTPGALVLVTLISVLTLREFYALMRGAGYDPFDKFGMVMGAALTLAPWLRANFGFEPGVLLPLAVVVFAIRLLGERTSETRVEALASSVFGVVYVPLMLSYMVAIITPLPGDAITPNGRLLLALWLVAVAKFCDVGALLTGLAERVTYDTGIHAFLAPEPLFSVVLGCGMTLDNIEAMKGLTAQTSFE